MTLKIVPASEPLLVENIVLTIYAAPGLGKSSLSFTADRPLMLDFDKGSYRAATRGDSVPVHSWLDVATMTAEDLAPYSTLVIDTGGRALDALSLDIIAGNPKMSQGSGSLSLKGFGELKSRFAAWKNMIQSFRKDIVIVCHMTEETKNDDLFERIDAQGASKNEIYKSSDAMCRIVIDSKGNRFLDFDPREHGFGKNPAQLPKVPYPHPTQNPRVLADVIAKIKESLNRMTEEQATARKEQENWEASAKECDTLEQFNSVMLKLAKERKGPFKKFVEAEAHRRGYVYDAKAKLFALAQQEAAVA